MDEGGIYEEGSPEEIFEHPEKELTRRFIKRLRVLEADIHTKNYDFDSFGAEIDRYCLANDVAPKDKYRILLAIEELVQQILLPRLIEPRIHVLVEYFSQGGNTAINMSYSGERVDPRNTENEMSYAVLKSTATELAYSFDPKESLPNRVELKIK